MKTVNFLEALEANKTKRVKLKDHHNWFPVNELVDDINNESRVFNAQMVYGKWIIEPEIIQFECEWNEKDKIYPSVLLENHGILCSLVGKKTKVTIEVLE